MITKNEELLFVNYLDSKFKYTNLFAGSLGNFTDIKQGDEGYAITWQMKHYNFPVRNPNGTFYAQVHPFDPSYLGGTLNGSHSMLAFQTPKFGPPSRIKATLQIKPGQRNLRRTLWGAPGL